MRKYYSLKTLLGTVPCVLEQFKLDAEQDDPDTGEYALGERCNFYVVNQKDSPACKQIPRLLTFLPFRNDVIVGDEDIKDCVGRNDAKEEFSPKQFQVKSASEMLDAIKRFSTLASGKVNPNVLAWITRIDFADMLDKFMADGASGDTITDEPTQILLYGSVRSK